MDKIVSMLISIDSKMPSVRLAKMTSQIFVGSALLIATNIYFSSPMVCFVGGGFSQASVDSYCWLQDSMHLSRFKHDNTRPWFGRIYQWFHALLLAEAVLFALPGWIWSYFEGGAIKHLLTERSQKNLASKIVRLRGRHKNFLYGHVITDSLVLLLFGLHMCVSVLLLMPSDLASIFPTEIPCNLTRYGDTGKINNNNVMCQLPLNLMIPTVLHVIQVWLLIAFVASAYLFVCLLIAVTSENARIHVLQKQAFESSYEDIRDLVFRPLRNNWVKRTGEYFFFISLFRELDDLIKNDVTTEVMKSN